MSDDQQQPPSSPGRLVALGVMWFLIFLGFGGCAFLSNQDSHGPLFQITTQR